MEKYYEILELPINSNLETIKKKYRQLSKIYHPDKNNGDDTKMKLIVEAYNNLSNYLQNNIQNNNSQTNNPQFNNDIIINVNLNFIELCLGKLLSTTITKINKCNNCVDIICNNCKGTGMITQCVNIGFMNLSQQVNCWFCVDGYTRCNCNNIQTLNINVNLPPGLNNNNTITLNEPGNYLGKNKYTKIIIVVSENINDESKTIDITKVGNDIHYNLNISLLESLIGFNKIFVHPIFNNININYDKVSNNSTVITLENKGFPILHTNNFGNLIIKIIVNYNDEELNTKIKNILLKNPIE
jgi:DnaJ-class molecular chaperone